MLDPKHDPFFAQLKADIQSGIDQVERGATVSANQVLDELDAAIVARDRREREGYD